MRHPPEQIFSVVMTQHADVENLYRDCDRAGVLYQDLTKDGDWAGTIRFVGYLHPLTRFLEDNWGSVNQHLVDGPVYEDWADFVEKNGYKL